MATIASRSNAKTMAGNVTVLVTGGAGFIGANFVLEWLSLGLGTVVNLDKLTYAGNRDNLAGAAETRTIFSLRVTLAMSGS